MEMKKSAKIFKIIMLVFLTSFITFIITVPVVYKYIENNSYKIKAKNINGSISNSQTTTLDATLRNFKSILENKYIGEIKEEQLIEGAIKGYVQGLGDEYTQYLSVAEMDSLKEETSGEYIGIGVYIANDTINNQIVILRTIGNSPAYKSGLLPGDIIEKIDGKEYSGEQLTEASKKLKGQEGTEVKIIILRNSEEKEIVIKREVIKLVCVNSKILNKDVGYIRITSFDGGCAKEFEENYAELQKKGIKSLVIDLRFNGGGLVEEALNIADLAVEKDKTLLITKSKSSSEITTKSKQDKTINIPIVVLVNEYSASASEILTGILKEVNGAKVIGEKTYGKGVIQTVYSLSDGSGLKITTDEYFTPNHNKINKVGILPDIEIQLPEEVRYNSGEISEDKDTQLKKAIEELNNL
ncbi:MAG TPA: S41 family peptidase [Clostridia bacterium]|nr:S41 family peptidase [Clostridia bacterium]